jgi:hypothetical protein
MTIPSTLGFRTTVEILGRTARLRRQLGNSALVYAIARRAVQRLRLARFVRIYAAEVYCLSLTENDSMAPPLRRFQVRAAGEPDTAALMAYYGTPKLVQRRMDRGDTCFIAESKSEIGAAVWISLVSSFLRRGHSKPQRQLSSRRRKRLELRWKGYSIWSLGCLDATASGDAPASPCAASFQPDRTRQLAVHPGTSIPGL